MADPPAAGLVLADDIKTLSFSLPCDFPLVCVFFLLFFVSSLF